MINATSEQDQLAAQFQAPGTAETGQCCPSRGESPWAKHMSADISITTNVTQNEAAEWDSLVDSVPYSDVAQLSKWARVREAAGYSPVYLFMREGGRIIAGAQILRRKVPLLGWIYYLSGGPLIAPSLQDREPLVRQLSQSLQGTLAIASGPA